VAVVTLDDPDHRNVLSTAMVLGIGRAFDQAEADGEVRSVVITGAGTAFCAGAELGTLFSAANGNFTPVAAVYDGFLRALHSPLLTIAAVNGAAVGAGMNLALACDLRLAGPRARFDARFTQLRLHPGGGHVWLPQRAVGYQRVAAACLLSTVWNATDAADVGLVLEVVDDDLVAAAIALGGGMDGLEQSFARELVSSFRASWTLKEHDAALALEASAQQWCTTLPGFVAGSRRSRSRSPRTEPADHPTRLSDPTTPCPTGSTVPGAWSWR